MEANTALHCNRLTGSFTKRYRHANTNINNKSACNSACVSCLDCNVPCQCVVIDPDAGYWRYILGSGFTISNKTHSYWGLYRHFSLRWTLGSSSIWRAPFVYQEFHYFNKFKKYVQLFSYLSHTIWMCYADDTLAVDRSSL